jgi:hypothetical protein
MLFVVQSLPSYGVRFKQTKLQMEALPPSTYNFQLDIRLPAGFASNPPYDIIPALVQLTKAFRVSKSAKFAMG